MPQDFSRSTAFRPAHRTVPEGHHQPEVAQSNQPSGQRHGGPQKPGRKRRRSGTSPRRPWLWQQGQEEGLRLDTGGTRLSRTAPAHPPLGGAHGGGCSERPPPEAWPGTARRPPGGTARRPPRLCRERRRPPRLVPANPAL